MPRLYDKLWLVYVSWEDYGAGASWTFIVSAPEDWIAIGKTKDNPEILKSNPISGMPTGIWSFHAEEIKPKKGLCHVIVKNSYGGW